MVDIRNIHSLSDFQRNTKDYISQLESTHQPVVLTVNGKAALVIQDAESYQQLLDELELSRSARAISKGIEEFSQGKGVDAREGLNKLRSKHDIPD
ncbi:type II toxin-antitoxin system Phd/YefM family antitoxin [Waterburya agarophytonicola K14]|uniref:Antitoxin n=1 Tax=Waterburya agarophytonicola KI4 TaxID=2874699 RepID=A0A964BUB0_9CYAN|nr:type II toxin-antitoxin system Phd/YefM family antitoxin [Waterburya agarophytonicola]MCC0178055.1 type II toxin-antitoxin system Phd/YefM family antitoxin [Waterburya agarophytonicola KI4]